MFISEYVPVNLKRTTEAILSSKGILPAELLRAAMFVLEGGELNGIMVEGKSVYFTQHPDVVWDIADIIPAYSMLEAATDSNFSYYTVTDEFENVQMLVSKLMGNIRLVVFTSSMETFIVKRPALVKLVSSFIDKHCALETILRVRATLQEADTDLPQIEAILVDRDSIDDGFMAINPMLSPTDSTFQAYGYDLLQEVCEILDGASETESLLDSATNILWKNHRGQEVAFTKKYARYLADLYHELLHTKCNYVPLYTSDDGSAYLYISTNLRYLIKATTFEQVILKNIYLQNTISSLCDASTEHSRTTLEALWEVAYAQESKEK